MLAIRAMAVPKTMQAVVAKAEGQAWSCVAPEWSCLDVGTYPTPSVGSDEALIRVKGSSVNPYNIDLVEFPHREEVIGGDASGVVVAVGSDAACSHLSIGSEVWAGTTEAYAEYATAPCASTGLKPPTLSFLEAGTMPVVGITSLQCLQATGAPWSNRTSVTVVITSGQGGTGFIAIQLAKALGATKVVTAASGEGISFVKKLGADVVVDFRQQNVFDALPDDSVDIVFDNYGAKGTADRAMRTIRAGGVFLILKSGGGGTISENPKAGVKQVSFGIADLSNHNAQLDVLGALYEMGMWEPRIQAKYPLTGIKDAFNQDKVTGNVMGKLAIVP